jgi:hypothetical protein
MEICHGEQPEMMRYWVWLAQVFGAGSTKLLSFLPDAESPQEICEAVRGNRQAELSVQQRTESRRFTLDDADRIVHFCRSSGIELLPINSSRYPGVLRSIPSPPVLLTACGNTELLDNPLSLAVVGTRHPSPYTERVTSAMVGPLAQQRPVFVLVAQHQGFVAVGQIPHGGPHGLALAFCRQDMPMQYMDFHFRQGFTRRCAFAALYFLSAHLHIIIVPHAVGLPAQGLPHPFKHHAQRRAGFRRLLYFIPQ